jgi:hypothetical protein
MFHTLKIGPCMHFGLWLRSRGGTLGNTANALEIKTQPTRMEIPPHVGLFRLSCQSDGTALGVLLRKPE